MRLGPQRQAVSRVQAEVSVMLRILLVRFALVMALPVLATGCESNNQGRLEGTHWVSQSASFKGSVVPAGTLKLSFYKDGTLCYRVGRQTYNGKYSLGMGDTVVFNLDRDLAGYKTHHEKCVVVEDRLTVTDGDGTKINFTKTK
jgi:hypothetical protein